MNKITLSFLISLLAGISTVIGFLFIYIKGNKNKVITSALAFASGVMFIISILDLIPESIKTLSHKFFLFPTIILSLLFINIGIILSKYLNKKLDYDNKLYKVGFIAMLAIIIHNIPEGIITFVTTNVNTRLGISLAIVIALHNIPEGISISIPIYYSTKSKFKAFIYTFISGLSEFVGALLAYIFLKDLINDLVMGSLYSLIAGIMLYISICELLPTSILYKNIKRTLVYFIIGVIFMLISHILI